ncbi:MAG: DHH family phosphoesterase [Anaerovoracaceae bacterium]
MNSNISLKGIGDILKKADSILIFTHVNPDGDAAGSASALCSALRDMKKKAWVIVDEDIPGYIDFINTEYFTTDKHVEEAPDVCVCVDCSEQSRINGRFGKYNAGKTKICIDHHLIDNGFEQSGFADYYYIDSDEAAASQIVYKLLKAMKINITVPIAEAIYTGIVTDTGSFQYSNTTYETHMIAAELLNAGIDKMKIMISLYQSVSLSKIKLQNKIMDTLEIFCGGKAAAVYVTQDMVKNANADVDDSEGVIDTVRNINGIEIAAFLKEKDDSIKVSLRAKSEARVDDIASYFGGGGHMKAAGCTLNEPISDAKKLIIEKIEKYLEN